MSDAVTLDSGRRQTFGSGAVCDVEDGKPRYELLPADAVRRVVRAAPQVGDVPAPTRMLRVLNALQAYELGARPGPAEPGAPSPDSGRSPAGTGGPDASGASAAGDPLAVLAWEMLYLMHDPAEPSGALEAPDASPDLVRYDRLPLDSMRRVALLYARGAVKYDGWNWTKGIPYSRRLASLKRHLAQLRRGDTDEDHAAAVVWNALALLHYDERGRADLFDLFDYARGRARTPARTGPGRPDGEAPDAPTA